MKNFLNALSINIMNLELIVQFSNFIEKTSVVTKSTNSKNALKVKA